MGKILGLCLLIAMGGCQTTGTSDVFCQTHRQSDFTFSLATIAVMTPVERRNALAILEEGSARCGWKAGK